MNKIFQTTIKQPNTSLNDSVENDYDNEDLENDYSYYLDDEKNRKPKGKKVKKMRLSYDK